MIDLRCLTSRATGATQIEGVHVFAYKKCVSGPDITKFFN